jgi:pimeloyl-ACP methyl ester carboxylesterase
MGALGSLGALSRAPGRFNRAVLMASPGFGRGLNLVLRLASVRFLQRFFDYGSRRSRYFFFDRFEAQKSGPSDERELWKEMHFQIGNRDRGIETFNEGLRSFSGMLGQRDILSRDAMAGIKAPTLLVWGDSDLIIPSRHSRRALDSIPDARLEILDNCGHIVQLESPKRVTDLMVDWFRV